MKTLNELLPFWFKGRKNSDSTTVNFLSIFKNQIDDLISSIEFAYNMTSIDKFENDDYITCKINLSENYEEIELKVDNTNISEALTELHFVKSIKTGEKLFFYDRYHNIVYISATSGDSSITINGKDFSRNKIYIRIWNADILDEYGLMYSMPRLKGESNFDYKERLLSYSKKQGNSSYFGVASYLGHYIGCYKTIKWVDGGVDIKITDDRGVCLLVFVDNAPYTNTFKNDKCSLVLKGDKNYRGESREVCYFFGFNIKDISEMDFKFKSNNEPSKELLDFYEEVSKKAPICYGSARWDKNYFADKNEKYIKIAPTFDPDLSKLKE